MNTHSVATITEDVRVCLDELGVNEAEFLMDSDSSDMDSVIASKIPDALRFVNMNADVALLEPKVVAWVIGNEYHGKVYRVRLERDFLRFCYATMEGWSRPVVDPILFGNKEYAALKNPITTGYPDNPKAALVLGRGEMYLELYTCPKSGNLSAELAYMPVPEREYIDVDGCDEPIESYSISDKVYKAVVYYTAGLTLMTFKDAHADSLMNQSLQIIGVK